jgi:hypothetical protein
MLKSSDFRRFWGIWLLLPHYTEQGSNRFLTGGNEENEGVLEICGWRIFVFLVVFCLDSFVHPLWQKADRLSQIVIGAAIEVHPLKSLA